MVEITCPVCKNHCLLTVEQDGEQITVSGNKCARGELHAKEELRGERKVVTYHAATTFASMPSVPVKTTGTVPKELVFRLIRLIKKQVIDHPMQRGEVLPHHPPDVPVDVVLDPDVVQE